MWLFVGLGRDRALGLLPGDTIAATFNDANSSDSDVSLPSCDCVMNSFALLMDLDTFIFLLGLGAGRESPEDPSSITVGDDPTLTLLDP
eukprot:CAMPEP_0206181642 /NCGR_PEP_ID=MMETSP1474-20131121/68882_1 /ASSEMBLY_ACC=CAM_ASM_001110 /TAXON_ID=97495 /ORGANISM="Imantonia sp., Strain RCC918" /LENGTH=88 /DNA_ID=CAMNT_0053595851 /DNA_START=1878 /DNA_END=2141 /DNA_ORIENTATION=+